MHFECHEAHPYKNIIEYLNITEAASFIEDYLNLVETVEFNDTMLVTSNKIVLHYTDLKNIRKTLSRNFIRQTPMEVLVSDLTYVKVSGKWHYICVFIDLFNREIVGHSAGPNKDSHLVSAALSTIKHDLRQVQMFHTDRGKEFDNHLIDDLLATFGIQRLLSMKNCSYDNTVAETTFKTLKTVLLRQYHFISLQQLKIELFDYVNCYNNIRLHGALGYMIPKEYKKEVYKNCLEYS